MFAHRSLLTIALGGFVLAPLALPGAQAQSPTAPTASIDPEVSDHDRSDEETRDRENNKGGICSPRS